MRVNWPNRGPNKIMGSNNGSLGPIISLCKSCQKDANDSKSEETKSLLWKNFKKNCLKIISVSTENLDIVKVHNEST